jgi:hypothetical protein
MQAAKSRLTTLQYDLHTEILYMEDMQLELDRAAEHLAQIKQQFQDAELILTEKEKKFNEAKVTYAVKEQQSENAMQVVEHERKTIEHYETWKKAN